ncbi:MAG TPA: cell envelope integrity protein TolA [Dissulfurispiraceae bacterium]|nr:cell envelope integrity protein TolA [Dissulfurispiraceae bacterium]
MKEQGIGTAITLSFFLHVAIVTISLLIGRGLYTRKLVPTYVVSLVSPSQTSGSQKVSPSGASQEAAAPEIAKQAEKPRVESQTETRMKKESYTTTVIERIEELRAIQKLQKLMALRKIIDIGTKGRELQSKNSSGAASRNNTTGSGGANAGGGDYYSLVEAKIRQQWIYPDTLDTDLQTVVSIRVAKDGGITIEKVEKGSGNQLFDRSVLRAITMASPLPPPLNEMEIGLRFRP